MNNNIQCPICIYNTGPLTPDEITRRCALYMERYPFEQFAIINFEDILPNTYYITNYGRIFSIDGRQLCPMFDTAHNDSGNMTYLRIELGCVGGKRRKFYVHRLVINTFVPKTQFEIENGKDLVNHKINRDGTCNYAWNLEWCDAAENLNHAKSPQVPYDKYLFDPTIINNEIYQMIENRTITNRPTKITDWQADAVCHAYFRLGYSPQNCAIYANLEPNKNTMKIVYSIIQGKSWHHISAKYGVAPIYHK